MVMAFEEGGEDINQVGVDTSTFIFGGGADGVTDITRKRVGLGR